MKNSNHFLNRVIRWWTLVRVMAFILLLLAAVIGVLGYLNQHAGLFSPLPLVTDFYANISAELASIAITVLVIDTLNERRSIQQEKAALIFQMGSPTNSIAREAIRNLRLRGWLTDNSLQGANLSWANLEDAYLERANLPGVNLFRAKLKGAHLEWSNLQGVKGTDERQFAQIRNLRGATLPDGSLYDGRFNLLGDLRWAQRRNVNPADPAAMAEFYRVPLEVYLDGQTWARKNLTKLHSEINNEATSSVPDDGHQPQSNQLLYSVYFTKILWSVFGVLLASVITLKLMKDRSS